MTDHQGHAKGKPMTDIVDRARRALSDYEHVKALGVSPCPDMAYRLVADLIAELERLREVAIRPDCACGEPYGIGVVHRVDAPCYVEEAHNAD